MISVFGSAIEDDEIEAVVQVMRSQWLGLGKKVDEFEAGFSEHIRAPFCMVDSGSNALYLALKLLDLPLGSEVIVPTFTWVSCAQAVLLNGLKPVFCDVDYYTMNITKQTILRAITRKTSAIMVVHYAGLPVEMEPIQLLGFPVIEDAAHAVDSTHKGKACGTIADVGIYSFDAIKNLTTGEGGGITSPDPKVIERAKVLRYCGIGKSGFEAAAQGTGSRWWEYNITEPWIKMLPTNIAGAIGVEQLKRLEFLQAKRKDIWRYYKESFHGMAEVQVPVEPNTGDRHSYFTFCIRIPERDKLAQYLLSQGIYTTLRYHPLHMNKIYGQKGFELPNAERLNEEALSIPLHPKLTDEDVDSVIWHIKAYYGNPR